MATLAVSRPPRRTFPRMTPFWLTAFLDLAGGGVPTAARQVLARGHRVRRCHRHEASTASSPRWSPRPATTICGCSGSTSGPARIHLDLHVADPRAAADRAVVASARSRGGARPTGTSCSRSPGGLTFCFVAHPAARCGRPRRRGRRVTGRWSTRCASTCRGALYDVEAAFWAAVLEAEPERAAAPAGVLLAAARPAAGARRAAAAAGPRGRARWAHTSTWAPATAPAEVARHVALGAELVVAEEFWTVLRDPAGLTYCITDRDPRTGRLG